MEIAARSTLPNGPTKLTAHCSLEVYSTEYSAACSSEVPSFIKVSLLRWLGFYCGMGSQQGCKSNQQSLININSGVHRNRFRRLLIIEQWDCRKRNNGRLFYTHVHHIESLKSTMLVQMVLTRKETVQPGSNPGQIAFPGQKIKPKIVDKRWRGPVVLH